MLSKWKDNIQKECTVCGPIETTKHMLYECLRIRQLWNDISNELKINISWKNIVCGFTYCELSDKIKIYNILISTICYTIFRENSVSKFDKKDYGNIDVRQKVKYALSLYFTLCKTIKMQNPCLNLLLKAINCM